MPSRTEHGIAPFPDNVPTADISTIDFDLLAKGDQSQAKAVFEAARGYGFFYIKHHHVDSDFMFDLANEVFKLPQEEKDKYDMGTTGGYFGYKKSGAHFVDEKGTKDHTECYNISKDDILRVGDKAPLQHPLPVNERREEVEDFMRSCHKVVTVIARALSEQLGLGPDTLLELHRLDRTGGDQARVTHAPPVSADTIALGELNSLLLCSFRTRIHSSPFNYPASRPNFLLTLTGDHTDFGSITVLFNRIGGLQVLNPDSHEWRYVRPEPGCAIINLGDAIVKLVGEQLYSGVHRVVGPPGPQAKSHRHSVVYFSRPNGDVRLGSLFGPDEERANAPTADEWIAQRARLRNIANYKGPATMQQSRGTEHHTRKSKSDLDRPATAIEAV
jgi:isopenicillin N synthase-like dioxygenase